MNNWIVISQKNLIKSGFTVSVLKISFVGILSHSLQKHCHVFISPNTDKDFPGCALSLPHYFFAAVIASHVIICYLPGNKRALAFVVEAEEQISGEILIHLYLREAIIGFVSMQHWPHWPIYHSKNRTTQAWCLMEVTGKEIWIAYIFILHHFCAQSSYACSRNSTCHSKGDFKVTSKDVRPLSVWLNWNQSIRSQKSIQNKTWESWSCNPGEKKHMQRLTNCQSFFKEHTVASFTPAEASHHFIW